MTVSTRLVAGSMIRWRKRCFVVMGCDEMDTVIAQERGKAKLERIPLKEVLPDHGQRARTARSDLVSVLEKDWHAAVKHFKILKPLLKMSAAKRTLADVQKVAHALGRHPATIYRWIEKYTSAGLVSALLRKGRSDRGESHLSRTVNSIIDAAINKVYLSAERPNVAAVIEEVAVQCFKAKIKRPGTTTVWRRIVLVSDRIKVKSRHGAKAAAEKYEPLKGHFPADFPLAGGHARRGCASGR